MAYKPYTRQDVLMIKLTKTEKEQISKAAEAKGMTMSAYARALLIESTAKEAQ